MNAIRDMPAFLRHLPFAWEIVEQSPTVYTVRLGQQSFSFWAITSESNPERLADFVQEMTRHKPPLQDVVVNGIHGKAFGGFSDDYSSRAWWLRAEGSHVISFHFEGPGVVAQATKTEIDAIMNSLRRHIYVN